MQTISIGGVDVYKRKANRHDELKGELLRRISEFPRFGVSTPDQQFHSTDWWDKELSNRRGIFLELIDTDIYFHNLKLIEKLYTTPDRFGIEVHDIWFQQYAQNDFHSKHVHGGCSFANVYFLELTGENPGTTFYYMQNQYKVPVEEGDIITFPGFVEHESLPNKTDNLKTSIAFNSDVTQTL